MSKRIGVVLIFREGVDRTLAQAAVDKLVREQMVEPDAVVRSFNPEQGSPVWYIP